MADENGQGAFGPYAKQKLFRALLDFKADRRHLNWSSMAEQISDWRGIPFQRMNFHRLKAGTLGDNNVEIIVSWVEHALDPAIRGKLEPQAIFDELGRSARDYYFHLPSVNELDEWSEQVVSAFSGVYLCEPTSDINTFMPVNRLRRWFQDTKSLGEVERRGRSQDIKLYHQDRSILVLHGLTTGYFYAAEFPISALLSDKLRTLDSRMIFEGIGVVSANTIQVKLRECLSRVPKSHSILIKNKARPQLTQPSGLSFYLPEHVMAIRSEWEAMPAEELELLRRQHARYLDSDQYLSGPAQVTDTPLASVRPAVTMSFAVEYVYFPMPRDFLRHLDLHFVEPDLIDVEKLEKLIANPLAIGELL